MTTINSTLALGKKALLAHQGAMGMGADNVANVNTPGYARKRANLRSVAGLRNVLGAFGGGVDLASIWGERNLFVERQMRTAIAEDENSQTSQQKLQMIEEIMGELGEAGLSGALDRFWNAWQDLSNDPNSRTSRETLREVSRRLIERFHSIDTHLKNQRVNIMDEIGLEVGKINSITTELASINADLARHSGDAPDLIDRRSQLLDELIGLTGATYQIERDEMVAVFLDGVTLVSGIERYTIGITKLDSDRIKLILNEAPDRDFDIDGGKIGALFEIHDTGLNDLQRKIDDIAATLIREVNKVHRTGYGLTGTTGVDFFDPMATGMNDIALNYRIEQDPSMIAASADGNPGDNQIAILIAELEHKAALNEETETFGDAYASITSWFGAMVDDATVLAEGARLSRRQAEKWRESVSGVSLDEEMAQLIRHQLAFNASAKLISMADKMLEQVMALVR